MIRCKDLGYFRCGFRGAVATLLAVSVCCGCAREAGRGTARPAKTGEVSTHSSANMHDLNASLGRAPTEDEAAFVSAQEMWQRGDRQGYLRSMKRAITLAPKNYAYSLDLARKLVQMHRLGEAETTTRRIAEGDGVAARAYTPQAYQLLGSVLEQKGDLRGAEQAYEKACAQYSAFTPELLANGYSPQWISGQRETVFSRLRHVQSSLSRQRPSASWVRERKPWSVFLPSLSSGGRAAGVTIRQLEPRLSAGEVTGSDPHYELGTAYLASGRPEEAVVQFVAALELDRSVARYWRQLGWAYVVQGRLSEAADAFERAAKLGDQDSGALAGSASSDARSFQALRQKVK